MKARRYMVMLLLTSACGSSGCVSWYSTAARTIDPFPPPEMDPGDEEPVKIGLKTESVQIGECARPVFDESRYFRLVRHEEADYMLSLKIETSDRSFIPLTILCGLTLSILPMVSIIDYEIHAILKDRDGNALGERRLQQGTTTVVELFMLFGMPFAWPGSVAREMWKVAFKDLLVWSHELIEKRDKS